MKIYDFKSESTADKSRVSATVVWEDVDRPDQEIYFGTDAPFTENLSCNPHAFLVAAIMPAWRQGEKRVLVDAEVCPELNQGLTTAMEWFRHWYDWYTPDRPIVKIEPSKGFKTQKPPVQPRAACTLSGGVDSLASLRANRLMYPADHPASFKEGLLVYDLEVINQDVFKKAVKNLTELAAEADLALVPVYTNIKYLAKIDTELVHDPDFWNDFWQYEFMGACLAAVAHAFSPNLSSATIASHYDPPYIKPYGCHPLIDPYFSSSGMAIRHAALLTRYKKTEIVSNWDAAVDKLRVCNIAHIHDYFKKTGLVNCGQCEKCIRTMMTLMTLGKLKGSRAFPTDEVSVDLVNQRVNLTSYQHMFYPDILKALQDGGYDDLARVIEKKISEYNDSEWKKKWRMRNQYYRQFRRSISDFDERHLAGYMKKIKRSILPAK